MNTIKMKYILGSILIIFLSSCINSLNVRPIDPDEATADNVFVDEESYKQALAKIYASYAIAGQSGNGGGDPDIQGIDEGFSNYYRQFFALQQFTTDEAIMAWNDETIKDLHWHTWTSSDVFISTMYSRIYFSIVVANEFIRTSGDKIPEVVGSYKENLQNFQNEARFLRAFSYWHAIDMFGNVPFVTEENKPGAVLPEQIQRADLFDYLEKELIELSDILVAPGQNEYGRVDQAAAWMLLAKLYLNAEVYKGEAKNSEALTYLNKLMASPYQIDPIYKRIFSVNNNESPEIIFPICMDGDNTQGYGGTTFFIFSSNGGGMPTDGTVGGWGGTRGIKNFIEKFDVQESDFTTEDPTLENIKDKRGYFYFDPEEWTWEVSDVADFTHGIGVRKFWNLTHEGEEGVNHDPTWPSTDVPVFRLADAYLMYAEAVVRGGSGGDMTTAVTLVNQLRERAFENSDNNISQADLTLDFLIDERSRELYWECHRRTDLIRFGLLTGEEYLWSWKGNQQEGAASEEWRDLFPIPDNDMTANTNLEQNKGYK